VTKKAMFKRLIKEIAETSLRASYEISSELTDKQKMLVDNMTDSLYDLLVKRLKIKMLQAEIGAKDDI